MSILTIKTFYNVYFEYKKKTEESILESQIDGISKSSMSIALLEMH